MERKQYTCSKANSAKYLFWNTRFFKCCRPATQPYEHTPPTRNGFFVGELSFTHLPLIKKLHKMLSTLKANSGFHYTILYKPPSLPPVLTHSYDEFPSIFAFE